MNRKFESKLGSYNATFSHGNKNLEIIKTLPAFYIMFQFFFNFLSAINTNLQTQARKLSGIAEDKDLVREALIRQAFRLSKVLFAFASSTKNNVLKKAMKYTVTDLERMADDEFPATCMIIYTAAADHLAQLADFNITSSLLEAYKLQVQEYADLVQAPRIAISNRKTASENIKALFKDTDDLLKDQMDPLAVMFEETHPGFYKNYLENRKVINARTNATRAAGIIKEKGSGNVITDAMITVEGQPYFTNADAKGQYRLLIPVPGVYTLIVEKAGYLPVRITVEVKLGHTTTIDVEMAKAI